MIRTITATSALIIGITLPPASLADEHTRYVVDQVIIIVRDQPLGQGEIIHRLVTGDAMALTGQSDDTFVEVDLPNGLTGWVDSRYITATAIARIELERELTESRAAQAETEESLVRLSDDYRLINEEMTELRNSAGQPRDFEEQVNQLKQEIAAAQEQVDQLDRKNKELTESADWRWYLAGAGTLAAGVMLGLVLPRRRRRSGWDGL